jgi:glycosyltransferase involved in cell wall biosynthesis
VVDNLTLPAPGSQRRALHVLTLTPFYPTPGDDAQGCFVAEPLPLLARLGIINTVIAVQPFYRPHVIGASQAFSARSVRFFSLPGGVGLPVAGAFLFARLLNIARTLHQSHPIDVIHAHAALPCGHAAALISDELKIPFVVTVHGLDAYSTKQVKGPPGKWCAHVSKFVYRKAASVICISEKVRARVLEVSKQNVKTGVVYNGVDSEMFYPAANEPIGQSILCVGNLIPTKGHELLLRAFAAMHTAFPAVVCQFIGEGPERARLGRTAAKLGINHKVQFLGRRSRMEVANAMRRSLLFALPSSYEGLGCVYLEAMASAKTAIACRGQGIDEIIEHGINGWLITPGSQDEMTEALIRLLSNPQRRIELGQEARQTILQDFTLAHQAERLAGIYKERVV